MTAARLKVEDEHLVMMKIIGTRARELSKLSKLWQSSSGSLGGAKRCVELVVATDDLGVAVDFLVFAEDVLARGNVLNLDMARDLLPLLKKLMHSKFEAYAHCALRYVKMLLVQFTPVIQSQTTTHDALSTLRASIRFFVLICLVCLLLLFSGCRSASSSGTAGVDLTRDERMTRANDCYAHFKSIYDTSIAPIAKRQSPLGEAAKDTRAHLEKLLWTKV